MSCIAEPHRSLLAQLRATIRAAASEATETMSYGMPTFRLNGRMLLSYAAHKRHCSIYPASGMVAAALGDELAPYLAQKATIRFTAERPLPDELILRIVAVRADEVGSPKGGR